MDRRVNTMTSAISDDIQTAIIKNVITVVLCICINYVNGTLVHTFSKHQVLNMNPRYILYIHLVINDIILLTMFTLIQVLSYIVFTLNVSLCMVMVYIGVTASTNNPLTLAVMAVECYIAVCFPLRHSRICTVRKTYVAMGIIWLLSSLSTLPDIFVAVATESLEFFQSRVFCLSNTIFRHQHPSREEKRYIFNIVLMVLVWFILLYTYFMIISAAKAASADAKKARNTVLLHGFQLLLCLLTYAYNPIMQSLLLLFPNALRDIRFSVSILVHVLPRLISPVVYGLRDKTFRKYLKTLFCATNAKTHPQKTT
uniref:G-protein coupled receptors family 1 profile domain-containing protein n=1 Tax=Cynoglossus semilaevis TaxID=244447 RepID=A0A3P8X2N0_CYNSE